MYWFVDYIENVYHRGIFNTTHKDEDKDDNEVESDVKCKDDKEDDSQKK